MSFSNRCRLAAAVALSIATPLAFAQATKPTATTHVPGTRVCGAKLEREPGQDLALFRTVEGLRILQLDTASLEKSDAACAEAKGLGAGLFFAYPGEASARIDGGADFFGLDKTFGVLDPVICESYASGGLSVGLEDSNGVIETLPGLSTIDFMIGSREIAPRSAPGDFGPLVQCQTFPFETLTSNPPDVPAGGGNDGIFRSRFENAGDLVVEFLDAGGNYRIGQLDVTAGYEFSYRMRVTNVGEGRAVGVRLRDFAPAAGNPAGLGPAIADPVSWDCTARTRQGVVSACGSGSGTLAPAAFDLPAGASRSYLVQRQVPVGTPGQLTLIAGAAFSDPRAINGGSGELANADNGGALVLELLDNQPPTVTCVDASQAALPGTVNLGEDAAAVTYTCTVTDPDVAIPDTIVSFAVDNGASSFGPIAPVVVTPLVGDDYEFTLTPIADANGNAHVELVATDSRAGTRRIAFDVVVAADNDAPSFSVTTQDIDVFTDGTDPDGLFDGGVLCLAAPSGFNCEAATSAFFFGFDAGGGSDEDGQSIEPIVNAFGTIDASNCGINNPGENVSGFFAKLPEILPAVAEPVADNPNYALRFTYKTTAVNTASASVFCDFVFQDSGGAVSAPVRVNFTINDPAP